MNSIGKIDPGVSVEIEQDRVAGVGDLASATGQALGTAEEEMAEPHDEEEEEEEDGGWAAVGLPELSRGRRPSATARL